MWSNVTGASVLVKVAVASGAYRYHQLLPPDSPPCERYFCTRSWLRAACSGQFELGSASIAYSGPSIGVIRAGDGDAEAELARADEAMYEDKRRRRSSAS